MKMLSECRSCCSVRSYSPQSLEHIRPRVSYANMAKLATTVLLLFIVLIVVLVVYGESPTNEETPRTRVRSKILRKKKVSTTVAPIEEETTPVSPVTDIEEITGAVENVTEESETDSQSDTTDFTTERIVKEKSKQKKQSNRNSNPPAVETEGCGVCETEECISPVDNSCPTGLVLDRCACCQVCGAGEGNRCYNASLNLRYNPDIGMCGPGLTCLLRSDLEPTEVPEALCECQDKRMVCGSDNQTYSSECKLREVAHYNPKLSLGHWGPCVSVPWISTPVENTTIGFGEDVSMSCEVRGYPPPIIHWKFLEERSNTVPVILPGDDSSVVIVVRGGPEQMMTTSWIQIIAVTTKRQGTYFCIANNEEGMTQSIATVSVIPAPARQYNPQVLS